MKKQTIPSETKFRAAVDEFSTHSASLSKLNAERETAIAEASLGFDVQIAKMKHQLEDAEGVITRYAEARRQELVPADVKSVQYANVEIGWRMQSPSLQTCEDLSWEDVTAMIKKKLPQCIRVKEELNKVLVKQLIAIPGKDAKLLKAIGLKLVSEEAFFIKIK